MLHISLKDVDGVFEALTLLLFYELRPVSVCRCVVVAAVVVAVAAAAAAAAAAVAVLAATIVVVAEPVAAAAVAVAAVSAALETVTIILFPWVSEIMPSKVLVALIQIAIGASSQKFFFGFQPPAYSFPFLFFYDLL